jgi:hypothetical protein
VAVFLLGLVLSQKKYFYLKITCNISFTHTI